MDTEGHQNDLLINLILHEQKRIVAELEQRGVSVCANDSRERCDRDLFCCDVVHNRVIFSGGKVKLFAGRRQNTAKSDTCLSREL